MSETRSQCIESKGGDWSSSCCGAAMTTAGGDGTHGSTCWAECRKCGQPCDPVAPTRKDQHPEGCPCVVCNPVRCTDCGSANPYLRNGVCEHRRACEARQMMAAGVPSDEAARHAQRLTNAWEGVPLDVLSDLADDAGFDPADCC